MASQKIRSSYVTFLDYTDYNDSVYQLSGRTPITDNADLNDYKTPGNYIIRDTATAQTIQNIPYEIAGILTVSHVAGNSYDGAWSSILQEYKTVNGDVYIRRISTDATVNNWNYGSWKLMSGDNTSSLDNPGYQKLPSGLIIQWGSGSVSSDTQYTTITFPLKFPNRAFSVVCQNAYSYSRDIIISVSGLGQNGFSAYPIVPNGDTPTVETIFYWIALGQ